MKIVNNILEMQEIAISHLRHNKQVGLVPTMGALHKGHLSLVNKSLLDNEITIVTIFINPMQFAPNEDLDRYPHSIKSDIECLEKLKVDYLFMPPENEMYPSDFLSLVRVKELKDKLCGKSRPLHFDGVTTICCKLFNITMPSIAYFGQKDYQQYLIMKQMVKDLNIPVKLERLPIVRDEYGLALSSRNSYLQKKDKKEALNLYKSLEKAKELIKNGERKAETIKDGISSVLEEVKNVKTEYISISDSKSLEEITDKIKDNATVLIAIAIHIKNTRLIDNLLLAT